MWSLYLVFQIKKKSHEVYLNNNLYCCKTLQYHLIRGSSEQADPVVRDAESTKEAAYEHSYKYNLSHHHLCWMQVFTLIC